MSFIINPYAFGAAATITSIAIFATSESAAQTITAPASIEAGDLLVLSDFAEDVDPVPAVIPSGFTTLSTSELTGLTDRRCTTSYKIANGTEDGASLTGLDGSTRKVLVVYRANIPITSVVLAGVLSSGMTNADPTGPTILAGAGTPPLLILATYASTGAVDPRTFSTTKDGETGHTGSLVYQAYKFYAASPANTTIDMADEGSGNCVHGGYLQLT